MPKKKGNKQKQALEEEEAFEEEALSNSTKKGAEPQPEEDDEDDTSPAAKSKKKKSKKKAKQVEEEDDEEEEEIVPNKGKKKGGKSASFAVLAASDEDDDEEDFREARSKGPATGFAALMDEDEDEASEPEDEPEEEPEENEPEDIEEKHEQVKLSSKIDSSKDTLLAGVSLEKWCEDNKLTLYFDKVKEQGAEAVADLLEFTTKDLEEMADEFSMNKLTRRRFLTAIQALKDEAEAQKAADEAAKKAAEKKAAPAKGPGGKKLTRAQRKKLAKGGTLDGPEEDLGDILNDFAKSPTPADSAAATATADANAADAATSAPSAADLDTSKMSKAQLKRHRKKLRDAEEAAKAAKGEDTTKPSEEEPEIKSTEGKAAEEDGEEGEEKSGKKKKKKKKKGEGEKEEPSKPQSAAVLALKERMRKKEEMERKLREEAEEEERKRKEEEERQKAEEARLEEEKRLKALKRKAKIEEDKKNKVYKTAAQKKKEAAAAAARAQLVAQGLVAAPAAAAAAPSKPVYDKRKGKGKGKTSAKLQAMEAERKLAAQREEEALKAEPETKQSASEPSAESATESWEDEAEKEEAPESWEEEVEDWEKAEPVKQSSKDKPKETSTKETKGAETIAAEAKAKTDESQKASEKKQKGGKVNKKAEKVAKGNKKKTQGRPTEMRSPICCILGHVDTGKTKLLDKIRQTNVQDKEAGGITQQIGATFFPKDAILTKTRVLREKMDNPLDIQIPGLLVIDTPGHESFTNLRSRGSNLCDIAVLVVDIMHGLEQQTLESIGLLRQRKTPFVVALNKIDRCYQWKAEPDGAFVHTIKQQIESTKTEFEKRAQDAMLALAKEGLNTALYYENKDPAKYVSIVPTSAITGEGIPDLLYLLVDLTQTRMSQNLAYLSELQATVLEVKTEEGLGTTIDVVLVNGVLSEGETIVLCGLTGPIVTTIRALLTPKSMKEMRVKGEYDRHQSVKAAIGVKIVAVGMEQAIAGSQLLVCKEGDDVEELKDVVMGDLASVLSRVDHSGIGVFVQASTLGSLEALLTFLSDMKIPVAGINIGPVHKKDLVRAAAMLEHKREYATILAFDVKVSTEIKREAVAMGVQIFCAEIIYHLFDMMTKYMEEAKEKEKAEAGKMAVFPVVLEILKEHIYNMKDPILIGVRVKEGVLKIGTPLCVPEKNNIAIGKVIGLQVDGKDVPEANVGQEVACKIGQEEIGGHILYGRHFDHTHVLYSLITRQSIDKLKESFKDEMDETKWKLIIRMKRHFKIM